MITSNAKTPNLRLLAVSVKYPTLFQTWFINYLESLELYDLDISVASLFKAEDNIHPKTSSIKTQRVWSAKIGLPQNLLRCIKYFFTHLFKKSTYNYLSVCFTSDRNLKEALQAVLLLPGISLAPNIIHCHSEKAAFRLLPLLTYFDVPMFLTFHGLAPEGVSDLSRNKRQTLYKSIDRVFVNTEFAYNQCKGIVDGDFEVEIIPQGINLLDFPYKPKKYSFEKPVKILSVGRLDRLKGYQFAIQAVSNLLKMGVSIEYTIVGEGLYRDKMVEQIKNLHLSDHVEVKGPLLGTELLYMYHSSHVFLLPSIEEPGSWAETQGIVIQEAQASGLLTIATKTGGIPECIVDGETGFLVDQQSPQAIVEKIGYLLKNQDKWPSWQLFARKHVEKRFDYRDMGKRLLSRYEEILSKD